MEEAPGWASTALGWLGLRWPEGDGTRLHEMGDAWLQYADKLKQQMDSANQMAESIWRDSSGDGMDAVQWWWNKETGPANNLAGAVMSATKLGTALHEFAAQIRWLKSLFVVQCGALITAAVLAGIALAGSGGLAAAAEGGKRFLVGAGAIVIALVMTGVIAELLKDAEIKPAPETKPDPKKFGPDIIVQDWEHQGRPRCFITPDHLPIQNPWFTGDFSKNDPDFQTRGGGIFHIHKNKNLRSGLEGVTIEGLLQDPLQGGRRFNTKLSALAGVLGLPANLYHNAHLIGPYSGSEAMAGMYLAPQYINQGEQSEAESWLQDLHQYARSKDGFVQFKAFAGTHTTNDFRDLDDKGVGYSFLKRADYEAVVCEPAEYGPDGRPRRYVPTETYTFGFKVTPPLRDGTTVQAGEMYERYGTSPTVR